MKKINRVVKLFILNILILFIFFTKYNKYDFEKHLIRYLKFHTKQININNYEERLFTSIKYIEFLKESKHNIYFQKVNHPKVTFVTTLYNQENYLYNYIFSIQNQKLKEYELLFVDDFSLDNGTKTITDLQKKDERIKLIKNKKNMGTLYSRYIGQLNAKADYIIFTDCDDFVMENGIINSYQYAKKNNIDIIQFHIVRQEKNNIFISNFCNYFKQTINQPYLSYAHYYDFKNKKGYEYNYALWNKLIKRNIVNKAFKWIGENYLKEKIVIHNDLIVLFSLLRNANSYKYIDEIGYYYYKINKNSISNSWQNLTKSNNILHSCFVIIKFLYEKTDNNYLDKLFSIYKVENFYNVYNHLYKYLNDKEVAFITGILNKLIDSDYISIKDKSYIIMVKSIILKKVENHED